MKFLIGWAQAYNFRFAPSQWEMALLCNAFSHWLGTNLESALKYVTSKHDIQAGKDVSVLMAQDTANM